MQQDSKRQQAATEVIAQDARIVLSHFDQAQAAVPTICTTSPASKMNAALLLSQYMEALVSRHRHDVPVCR